MHGALGDKTGLRGELERLVGQAHVLEAGERSPYNHDATSGRGLWGHADAVVRPADAGEVAGVVRWCYEHDVAIVPRGGGTGQAGGAVPVDGGVVCSLERLVGVRELEATLWRMYVEAGMRTRDVQRLARENGLLFAPDPGASEQSQIGGNVASNAGGPHSFKYGATGDWVTGLEAVIAPGEVIEVGGPCRRDVAGYDIKSLLIGSEGTLAVITAVRLRLLPAPELAIPLVAFQRSRAQGCEAILEVLGSGLVPSVLEFLDGEVLGMVGGAFPGTVPSGAGFALLAEVDGSREEAIASGEELERVLGASAIELHRPPADALWRWRDGVSGTVTGVRGGKVSEDVVVPVERLTETLERFAQIAERHQLRSCAWGHGADGIAHATVLVDPDSASELRAAEAVGGELLELVMAMGGAISGEHGVGWIKRGRLDRQWPEASVRLHEQLKRAFDPKGLLNPGKKLARWPA